jgi:hypothetical protein
MAISASYMQQTSGYNVCAGTIASIDVNVGFQPDWVEVFNPTNDTTMKWWAGMPDGSGKIEGGEVILGVRSTAGAAMGSTKSSVASIAFWFSVAGVKYLKAAVAAGTAPTATTVPQNTWGLFGYEIVGAGTITALDAPANATGYATEALAIAAIPAQTASKVFFMYVTVINTAAAFVGATTLFDATGVTAHFWSVPSYTFPQLLGITPLNSSTIRGFRIGAHPQLQVANQTLYWRCGGGR